MRGLPSLAVSNNENLNDQCAKIELKFRLFFSNITIDKKSIHELIEDFLSIAKLSQKVAVVDFVFACLLESLDNSDPLKDTAQNPFPYFADWQQQVHDQ